MPDLILIAGRARSGKDTAARYLATHYDFHRVALADGFRASFANASGPGWDAHKELTGENALRRMMQVYGTECRVDLGLPDHWVDHAAILMRHFSHYHPAPRTRFVCTDVRYPHEPERFRQLLSRFDFRISVWKISRAGAGIITDHSSEKHIDEIDFQAGIPNNSTKARFYINLDSCALNFLGAQS